IDLPSGGFSGQPLQVVWTVTNQGIGITNKGDWIDTVYLARDAAGTDRIGDGTKFQHFGHVGQDGNYVRTGTIQIPNGLTGTFYVVVVTASQSGPYEFIFANNNTTVSTAIPITLTPSPDLTVTTVTAPTAAFEGDLIDVSWTVRNQGVGDAAGSWVDRVYL